MIGKLCRKFKAALVAFSEKFKNRLFIQGKHNIRRFLIVFAILAIMAPAVSYITLKIYVPQIESDSMENLKSYARMKADQIHLWLNERKGNAESFLNDHDFVLAIERFKSGDSIARLEIMHQIEHAMKTYGYSGISIINKDNELLLQTGITHHLSETLIARIPYIHEQNSVEHTNIEEDHSGHLHIDFIAPLAFYTHGNKIRAGTLILHVDPTVAFFPYIQTWPSADSTGEITLVRKESDGVRFLNELRHRKNAAGRLKISLNEKNVAAVRAVLDARPGTHRGRDYSNTKVLAAYHPVPGTDWMVVAKIDVEDAMRNLEYFIIILALSLIGTLILTSLGDALLWRQQERKNQNELLTQSIRITNESEQRFIALSQSINDAIITADSNGKILDWNQGAMRIFGYTKEQVEGRNLTMLMPVKYRKQHLEGFSRLVHGGTPKLLNKVIELEGLKKNSDVFPMELSLARWETSSGHFFSGIIRDITDRKISEKIMENRTHLYAVLNKCRESVSKSFDEKELFQAVSNQFATIQAIETAWIGILDSENKSIRIIASAGKYSVLVNKTSNLVGSKSAIDEHPEFEILKMDQPQWRIWTTRSDNEWETGIQKIFGQAGIDSAAYFSFSHHDKPAGIIALHSRDSGFFEDEFCELIGQFTSDISFALEKIETKAALIQTTKNLTESELRFRDLVENSFAGICIIQDGAINYSNGRFAEILGVESPDDIVGIDPMILVEEKDRPKVAENINMIIDNRITGMYFEYSAIRKDRTPIEINAYGTFAVSNGRPSLVCITLDMTEKKNFDAKVQKYITQLQNVFMHTVEVMNTMNEMRDPYTAGHERRVAHLAVAIGKEMGLDDKRLEGLRISGWFHDIGKITIPSELLSKPRHLSAAEYLLIKEHPLTGFEILKNIDFPWPVSTVVLQHHERIDGSGYPNRLKGTEILLEARIMSVADVVEAMASHRPYRPSLGLELALREIETGSGKIYDPEAATCCLRIFRDGAYALPDIYSSGP